MITHVLISKILAVAVVPRAYGGAARRLAGRGPPPPEDVEGCVAATLRATGSYISIVFYALVDAERDDAGPLVAHTNFKETSAHDVCLDPSACYAMSASETVLPTGFTWSIDAGGALLSGGADYARTLFRLRGADLVVVESCDAEVPETSAPLGDAAAAAFWAPAAGAEGAAGGAAANASAPLECYRIARWTEAAVPTTGIIECARTDGFDSLALTETCGAGETHCWSVELSQPTLVRSDCHDVRLVGGCWSTLEATVWPATLAARATAETAGPYGPTVFSGEPAPARGALDAAQCDAIAAVLFDTTYRTSRCAGCQGSLCASQDPAWYSNQFAVPLRSIEGSLSSIERGVFINAPECGFRDANCDPSMNHLGCNYDGGACCAENGEGTPFPYGQSAPSPGSDSPAAEADGPAEDGAAAGRPFGPDARIRDVDASCRVPWFQTAEHTWSYSRIVNDEVFATVPLALWRGVVEALGAGDAPGHVDLNASDAPPRFDAAVDYRDVDLSDLERYVPSMACPDCAVSDRAYETVPFTVETNLDNANGYANWRVKGDPEAGCASVGDGDGFAYPCTAEGEDNTFAKARCGNCGVALKNPIQFSDAFPPAEPRARFLAKPNLLVYGALLTQERSAATACERGRPFNRFLPYLDDRGDPCLSDDRAEREPFGIDATFMPSSDVYREENWDGVYDYYHPNELADSGLPFGFSYSMMAGRHEAGGASNAATSTYPRDFPVYWDVNLNKTRARDIVTLIRDGNYFDEHTQSVSLRLITTNRHLKSQLLTVTKIKVKKETGGGLKFYWDVNVVNAEPYGADGEWFRYILEIVVVALIALGVVLDVVTVVVDARGRASEARAASLNGGEEPENLAGLTTYVSTGMAAVTVAVHAAAGAVAEKFGNFFGFADLCMHAVSVLMIFVWMEYYRRCVALKGLDLHYDVYDGGPAWHTRGVRILSYNDRFRELQAAFDDIENVSIIAVEYKLLVLFNIILTVIQLLKRLDFHPNMGVITRTVSKSGSALAFWFLLQAVISILYSILGVILFSQSSEGFGDAEISGIPQAFFGFAMLSVAGMYDIGLLKDTAGMRDAYGDGVAYYITQVFYWSYMSLSFFIMFNALLAIIVSAYEEVREDIIHAQKDALLFWASSLFGTTGLPGRPVPLSALHHCLDTWVGHALHTNLTPGEGVDEYRPGVGNPRGRVPSP